MFQKKKKNLTTKLKCSEKEIFCLGLFQNTFVDGSYETHSSTVTLAEHHNLLNV